MGTPARLTTGQGGIAISRRNLWQDAVRSYTVFIDDRPVGTVAPWQTQQFEANPGRHTVRLRVGSGYSSSGDVPVDVRAGHVETLRTWSRARRLPFSWKGILTLLLNPTGYGAWTFNWDPFGLWGNPRPWIVLSHEKPQPGPRRFDADIRSETSAQLASAQTPLVRFLDESQFNLERHGYRVDDVDRFISRLRLRLQEDEKPTASELAVAFDTAARGYSKTQVDVFLEAVKANLS